MTTIRNHRTLTNFQRDSSSKAYLRSPLWLRLWWDVKREPDRCAFWLAVVVVSQYFVWAR